MNPLGPSNLRDPFSPKIIHEMLSGVAGVVMWTMQVLVVPLERTPDTVTESAVLRSMVVGTF